MELLFISTTFSAIPSFGQQFRMYSTFSFFIESFSFRVRFFQLQFQLRCKSFAWSLHTYRRARSHSFDHANPTELPDAVHIAHKWMCVHWFSFSFWLISWAVAQHSRAHTHKHTRARTPPSPIVCAIYSYVTKINGYYTRPLISMRLCVVCVYVSPTFGLETVSSIRIFFRTF